MMAILPLPTFLGVFGTFGSVDCTEDCADSSMKGMSSPKSGEKAPSLSGSGSGLGTIASTVNSAPLAPFGPPPAVVSEVELVGTAVESNCFLGQKNRFASMVGNSPVIVAVVTTALLLAIPPCLPEPPPVERWLSSLLAAETIVRNESNRPFCRACSNRAEARRGAEGLLKVQND